jgi:hypothetical protein
MTARGAAGEIFGREPETQCLLKAFRKRESLLICGPAGAGKSALLREAIVRTPSLVRAHCVWIEGASERRKILRQIAGALHQCGDCVICCAAGFDSADKTKFQRWLSRQTSRRLGGLAAQALRETRYWLFLDHLPPATHAVGALLRDFMQRCKTPLYLTARGHSKKEIGHAWKLFWNPERRLELGALTESAATELFHSCWQANGLEAHNLEEARIEILRASGKIPGAIRAMCALAREPRFQAGGHIKTRLLRTEFLIGMAPNLTEILPNAPAQRSQP